MCEELKKKMKLRVYKLYLVIRLVLVLPPNFFPNRVSSKICHSAAIHARLSKRNHDNEKRRARRSNKLAWSLVLTT